MRPLATFFIWGCVLVALVSGILLYYQPIRWASNIGRNNAVKAPIIAVQPAVETVLRESLISGSSKRDFLPNCPNYLAQEGTTIMLYNLNESPSPTNPLLFKSMEDYQAYAADQNTKGVTCPLLSITPPFGTQPLANNAIPTLDISAPQGLPQGQSGYGSPEFADNINAQFDPKALSDYQTLTDIEHPNQIQPIPTTTGEPSDNPMDDNWGGIAQANQSLLSGKYAGDVVSRPLYSNVVGMGRNEVNFMNGQQPPPNYVSANLQG